MIRRPDDPLRDEIQNTVVDRHVMRDVKDTSAASYFWRKAGNFCEGTAKVLVISQGVVSFAAAYFNMPLLSFVSGGVTAVAVGFYSLSSYSQSESKERTQQMNMMLRFKGMEPVPVIAIDSALPEEQQNENFAKLPPINLPIENIDRVGARNEHDNLAGLIAPQQHDDSKSK